MGKVFIFILLLILICSFVKSQPSRKPTARPSFKPTRFPTRSPTRSPTRKPTHFPTSHPTSYPTSYPTAFPTSFPTSFPTALPTKANHNGNSGHSDNNVLNPVIASLSIFILLFLFFSYLFYSSHHKKSDDLVGVGKKNDTEELDDDDEYNRRSYNYRSFRAGSQSYSHRTASEAYSRRSMSKKVPSKNDSEINNKHENFLTEGWAEVVHTGDKVIHELDDECWKYFDCIGFFKSVKENWTSYIYTPYLPSLHRPGWLLRYLVGPYSGSTLFSSFFSDVLAGITVALIFIPQGLSYAQLANIPAVNGLYSGILPGIGYAIFGSSMQLHVGVTAVVTLILVQLVNKYGIDYENNPQQAIEFVAEASLAVGMIHCIFSLLNLGYFIHFISHPVMTGFTTAAAMVTGLGQLKSAFGFTVPVPQTGMDGYPYNYQVMKWFADNWYGIYPSDIDSVHAGKSYRNPIATTLCMCLFWPLLIITLIKNFYPATPERKKNPLFNIWQIGSAFTPCLAIIFAGIIAYQIKRSDHFNDPNYHHDYHKQTLKIIGKVEGGLDFIKFPSMEWNFFQLLIDVFPAALISFMESYSVAHKTATQNDTLHLLNPSQELFSIGLSNILSGISSSAPVAGSFSRTSLNAAAGARTLLSQLVSILVLVIAISSLSSLLEFIPSAALAAVIWAAVYNLLSPMEYWNAWKHSKKDLFIMFSTLFVAFVFNTTYGLLAGIAASLLVLMVDTAFSSKNKPIRIMEEEEHLTGQIAHLLLRNDLNFLSMVRFSSEVTALMTVDKNEPEGLINPSQSQPVYSPLQKSSSVLQFTQEGTKSSPNTPQSYQFRTFGDKLFYQISSFFDYYLQPRTGKFTDVLPQLIVLDFAYVCVVDICVMRSLIESSENARKKNISFLVINTNNSISLSFAKFGFYNDRVPSHFSDEIIETYHSQVNKIIKYKGEGEGGKSGSFKNSMSFAAASSYNPVSVLKSVINQNKTKSSGYLDDFDCELVRIEEENEEDLANESDRLSF